MNEPNEIRPLPVDALDAWGSDDHVDTALIETDGIDENENILALFTSSIFPQGFHYLRYGSIPSSDRLILCNKTPATSCLACKIPVRLDKRDLLPAFDLIRKTLRILSITPNRRPRALRPQLRPYIERLNAGADLILLSIRRIDFQTFHVEEISLDGKPINVAAIDEFRKSYESGEIYLPASYCSMTNEELAAIPEIRELMQFKGIGL